MATLRSRLTVSARLVLAVVIPIVALSVISGGLIADRHDDVRRAEKVRDQVQVLDRLIDLRTALFAERVAWEILLPARRPPDDVLATTDFGQLILDDSAPLEQATDDALGRLEPQDRPFELAELNRIRAAHEEWSGSPDTIRARLEPLTTATEATMTSYATEVRNAAVDLGDWRLIAAGTTFQRSIRLPDDAAEVFGALSDLWAADPEDRLRLQSVVAAYFARYTVSTELFADSIVNPDGPVAKIWYGSMAVPRSIQDLLSQVQAGELSDVDRPPGEPSDVGFALLDAIDWIIEGDSLSSVAADEMADVASGVADDARSAERLTAAMLLLVILVSVIGAVLFGRSIVAPVRRLTDHAEGVGRGHLSLDPLPLHGPPDVAVASAAVNDVVATLRLLQQKSRALADIDLDHPSLAEPLPGELGASLQRSTEVLSISIVEREHLRSKLLHEATHDSLTGMANRSALSSALADLRARGAGGHAAVIFIDLDGFKQMRNRLGLGVADVALQVTAERIAELCPATSTIARLGGDEFVVVLSDATEADAVERAEAMVETVAAPVEVNGQVLHVRACAGVAVVDDTSASLAGSSDLLQRADLAVNDAKHAGPGTVVSYDAVLGRRVADQEDVEEALVAALRPDADELHVVFQPIVATTTGDLVGIEALVRWDRDGERVLPDEFVPIAERSGLIVQLDMWVLRTVTRQMMEWADVPGLAEVSVSVNVSGVTLLHPTYAADVLDALEAHAVDPGRLTLEVTETVLVTDLALAAAQLERLRALGVRVAIDDFGTGYTSIAHLRALPIDVLKIDRSFISDLPATNDRVLVQMIQDLAELLELSTIAEGVETATQIEVLTGIGCHALQGYYFSRPIDADEVARWIGERATPT